MVWYFWQNRLSLLLDHNLYTLTENQSLFFKTNPYRTGCGRFAHGRHGGHWTRWIWNYCLFGPYWIYGRCRVTGTCIWWPGIGIGSNWSIFWWRLLWFVIRVDLRRHVICGVDGGFPAHRVFEDKCWNWGSRGWACAAKQYRPIGTQQQILWGQRMLLKWLCKR